MSPSDGHRGCGETWLASDLLATEPSKPARTGRPGSAAFASEVLSEFFSTLGDFDSAGAIWAETVRTAEETEQPHTVAWSVMSLGFVAAIREGEEEARRHVEHALSWRSRSGSWGSRAKRGRWPPPRSHGATARPPQRSAPTRTSTSARRTTPRDDRRRPRRGVRTDRTAGARPEQRSTRSRRTPTRRGRAPPWIVPTEWPRRQRVRRAALNGPSPRSAARRGLRSGAEPPLPRRTITTRRPPCARPAAAARGAPRGSRTCRCTPWIERTESELHERRNAARTRCGAAPIDELTPQELQVATMAASQRSPTRTSPRELFLSVKTIEAHLHRAYRKLGVHSRRELPAVIGTADASASSRGTGGPSHDRG